MKNCQNLFAVAFLAAFSVSASAQIATYTTTTSNDANNKTDPNDITPSQSIVNSVTAPASHLIPAPSNGNNGLGVGYPFGYTVSAGTAFFPTSLATAESQQTYLTFTITPQTGTILDLSGINLSGASFSSDFYGQNSQVSGNLASGYFLTLTSSLDNYATSLYTLPFNANTSGADVVLPSAFSSLTSPVTFHLDLYGTAGDDEAAYVYLTMADGSVVEVDGTSMPGVVVTTPEPGAYALVGAGLLALVIAIRKRGLSVL